MQQAMSLHECCCQLLLTSCICLVLTCIETDSLSAVLGSTDLLWKFNLKSMKWDLEHGGGGVRRLGLEDSKSVGCSLSIGPITMQTQTSVYRGYVQLLVGQCLAPSLLAVNMSKSTHSSALMHAVLLLRRCNCSRSSPWACSMGVPGLDVHLWGHADTQCAELACWASEKPDQARHAGRHVALPHLAQGVGGMWKACVSQPAAQPNAYCVAWVSHWSLHWQTATLDVGPA